MDKQIIYLDEEMLKTWKKEGKLTEAVIVIDIREPMEYAREHIPGSRNIPIAHLNEVDFSQEIDHPVIFHCRLGNRTRAAQEKLLATGFSHIYCLAGGIEQWKKCGLDVVVNKKAPIDIMRQVQIVAGSLVLLGLLLGHFISLYWLWLSVFIGAGLIMSGMTGWCGMAKVLMALPWNKIKNS